VSHLLGDEEALREIQSPCAHDRNGAVLAYAVGLQHRQPLRSDPWWGGRADGQSGHPRYVVIEGGESTMCGISGVVTKDGLSPDDKVLIETMTEALRHRGPDGEGYHFDGMPGWATGDSVSSTWPAARSRCSTRIARRHRLHGEIYNYVEMIPGLKGRGHQFHTSSDTEVILHAYEDLGERCVDPLNGMFAFALWDTRRRLLLLARDRMGEKPLFYHHDPQTGRLTFASEPEGIAL